MICVTAMPGLLLASGVPLKHIQEWLGFWRLTTTAGLYAHLLRPRSLRRRRWNQGLLCRKGGDFGSRWGFDQCRGEQLFFP